MALVRCITALQQAAYNVKVGELFDDSNYVVVTYPTYFSSAFGTTADAVTIKGFYETKANLAVAVPSITNAGITPVTVDISGDALVVAAAVGDVVQAIPAEALPTHALVLNSYVVGADSVVVVFASDGTSVTGANKNFRFLITKLI